MPHGSKPLRSEAKRGNTMRGVCHRWYAEKCILLSPSFTQSLPPCVLEQSVIPPVQDLYIRVATDGGI